MLFDESDSPEKWPSTKKRAGRDVIVIVRHGRPALSKKVRLKWYQFRIWWGEYDKSGLAEGQKVPKKLRKLVANSDKVISSPLLRAHETAIMARKGEQPDEIWPELVEAPLPPPYLGSIRLRPKAWGTLARICWMTGMIESEEHVNVTTQRASDVATRLTVEAAEERMIVVFAHGWFNRMLGKSLRKQGWKCTKDQGDLHWKFRRYERITEYEAIGERYGSRANTN